MISNAHKLTEVELMTLLEKVVTLPEKRLEKLLKTQGSADETFMQNLAVRLPHFLTATLVQITKVCGKYHEIMKHSDIWDHLELEFLKRSNKLNNQHLSDVLVAFANAGKGSEKFFALMEETIVDSPIEFEENHLHKFLKAYSQLNYGSPIIYGYLSEQLTKFKKFINVTKMAEICALFAKASGSNKAGFGFYHECEYAISQEIYHNRLSFEEGTKIIESLFKHNIGSTDFQIQIEDYLSKKIEHEQIPELLNMARALYDPGYLVKSDKLQEDLLTALSLQMEQLQPRQIETLFWAVTRDRKLYDGIQADNTYAKMFAKALLNTVYKK